MDRAGRCGAAQRAICELNHRLSTLQQADRIYVMQAGKVVEFGSFEELVEAGGVFRELIKRQIV